MAYEFKLPDLGEGLTEGEIARWLVAEGQEIAEDDPVDRRAHLDRGLVGLDLDDGLVLDDGVALAHEPARDLALGQALAEIGQRERVRHVSQRSGYMSVRLTAVT